MENLLSILGTIPEYGTLLECVSRGESAAVTGIGQVCRSHMIAGLYSAASAPIVVICQDDLAAQKMQEELRAFLSLTAPILPRRELT